MTVVAPASQDDLDAIASLLEEMDRFYGAADTQLSQQRLAHINDAIFATPPAAHVLLAWENNKLAGLASYSFLWPAVGVTQSLYLKELYVAQQYRYKGIGRLLMRHICHEAAAHKCSRVEWTTDHDNPDARQFYEKLDLQNYPSKIFYRLEGPDIQRMAEELRNSRIGPAAQ